MTNDVLDAGDVQRGVDPATFDKVFETNWPELDAQFAKAKKDNPAGRVDKRAVADVQDEMLQLCAA